jgi:Arc/MetJ-type ribon-helix-helix transcriptional regulator
MEQKSVYIGDEQDSTIEQLVDASGATGRVPVLNRSEVLRAILDAGIDAIADEQVTVEREGEVVADGADVAALAEQVAQEVEGR